MMQDEGVIRNRNHDGKVRESKGEGECYDIEYWRVTDEIWRCHVR